VRKKDVEEKTLKSEKLEDAGHRTGGLEGDREKTPGKNVRMKRRWEEGEGAEQGTTGVVCAEPADVSDSSRRGSSLGERKNEKWSDSHTRRVDKTRGEGPISKKREGMSGKPHAS